ncbi:hypothetical protein F7R21_31385 [Burkholderia latens]|uniref:Uncharacterized protein n=1 Tax=Burkholderia latens TaxID=488446 RepID=A0A6H9SSB8_9BURK|nr:hypothetical protein F7R21_31385 [Burkholderia latens]
MRATPNFRARTRLNCIPAFQPGLCLCRQNPADYAHDEARRGLGADVSAHTRPIGDAAPLTSCRQTNRS